jgi:hypothetical protein
MPAHRLTYDDFIFFKTIIYTYIYAANHIGQFEEK